MNLADKAKHRIIASATRAFLDQGYERLSMSALAEYCGLTRRALYHHFSSKEEVLRAAVRTNNALAMLRGHEAGREALAHGASAIDTIAAWLDQRFGTTRRNIGESAHGQELNDAAFRLATDIMIEVSYESNLKLAELVAELCESGQLTLRPGYDPERIGRLIGDGARGVNQSRPPFPNHEIAARYRDLVEAILFGCAIADAVKKPGDDASVTPRKLRRASPSR